jgi:hypothetical protein
MAIIQRPGKEGNATTYQGKVAAGYTKILASEVDLDIETIYTAWNAGADSVNIKPGAVGTSQLAASAVVTTVLADQSVTTPKIADANVTTQKILDGNVTQSKLSAALQGIVGGTFPGNVNAVAEVTVSPRVALTAASAVSVDLVGNTPTTPSVDNSKPAWMLRLDYGSADNLQVVRWPTPNGTAAFLLFLDNAGNLTITGKLDGASLKNLSVARAQLAINAGNGAPVYVPSPNSFSLSTAGVWTTFATLPALTTRGGFVHLFASPCASVSMPGASGSAICSQRWLRDGTGVMSASFEVSSSPTTATGFTPVPGLHWLDTGAASGSHTYVYQVQVGVGCTMLSTNVADGGFIAAEIG